MAAEELVAFSRDDANRIMSAVERVESGAKGKVIRKQRFAGRATLRVYEATADASGGEVTVKWVESDGTVVGDTITLKVLP